MDSSALIISGMQIAASVGSIVLFLIGLYAAVQDFQYSNPSDPADELAHTKAAAKKSLLMVLGGILLHAVAIFFRNLPTMVPQGYGSAIIFISALLESLQTSGLLLLCPLVIHLWRRLGRRSSKK